jgi:hypothetical protein
VRNLSGFGHLLIRSRTVIAFLLEIVPLEIERRAVNDLVKERPFQLVIVLCAGPMLAPFSFKARPSLASTSTAAGLARMQRGICAGT